MKYGIALLTVVVSWLCPVVTEANYNSTCPMPPMILDTSIVPTPTGTRWSPVSGDDLQNALNSAVAGDEIVLNASTQYVRSNGASIVLPAKSASNAYILIRPSTLNTQGFPGNGARVESSQASLLPKILIPANGVPALMTAAGAHHYWIIGVEFLPAANVTSGGTIVALGDGGATSTSMQADHIVLDRAFVHASAAVPTHTGVAAHGTNLAVINSRIADILLPKATGCNCGCSEAHGISIYNGPGPYKIHNDYIAAATLTLMIGGYDPPSALMNPQDIELSNNHFYKPLSWRGSNWLVKGILELKNAQRVRIIGNYFENAFSTCDQDGPTAIVLTVRNQTGTAPWSNVTDINFANNKVINAGRGGVLLGSDNNYPSGQMNCIQFTNNLFDKLPGDFAGDFNADGRFLTIGSGSNGAASNVTIQHNTVFNGSSIIYAYDATATHFNNNGFIYQNNLTSYNGGIGGVGYADGTAAFNYYFAGLTFARNDIIGASAVKYGTCTDYSNSACSFYSPSIATVNFTNYANANYQLLTSSPDCAQCSHKFITPSLPQDIGVYDWSADSGIGAADQARDAQPDGLTVSVPNLSGFSPSSGTIGTVVTLTGSSFNGATVVSFNGVASNFVINSGSQVVATVPANATTGTIRVITPGGTAISSTSFTVTTNNPPPPPPPSSLNLVADGGFEVQTSFSPLTSPWFLLNGNQTSASSSTAYPYSGSRDLLFQPTTSSSCDVGQKVIGLSANTNYTLALDLWPTFGTNDEFDAVVWDVTGTTWLGGFAVKSSAGGYMPQTTSFNTGSFTSILIEFYLPQHSGMASARIDAVTLTPVGVSLPTITSFTPASGPLGASVILTGTNFTGASVVKFSGVLASFAVNSSTQIITTVPAGAITGTVSVTTPSGTATSSSSFIVASSVSSSGLADGGFEVQTTFSPSTSPWFLLNGNQTSVSSSTAYPYSGSRDLLFQPTTSSSCDVGQKVTVSANTNYTLSFKLWPTIGSTDEFDVVVWDATGTTWLGGFAVKSSAGGYVPQTTSFNTGSFTGILIEFYLPQRSGIASARVDAVTLQ